MSLRAARVDLAPLAFERVPHRATTERGTALDEFRRAHHAEPVIFHRRMLARLSGDVGRVDKLAALVQIRVRDNAISRTFEAFQPNEIELLAGRVTV